MIKKWTLIVLGFTSIAVSPLAWSEGGPHRIGVGAHYWKTLDRIDDDDFEESGVAWGGTYQYRPGLLGAGVDVVWIEAGLIGSERDLYDAQAYLILGAGLYAAAGIGTYVFDGEIAEEPFYLFRAGFDFELLPSLRLDVHGVYRFENLDQLSDEQTDIDTDMITVGAAVRYAF